MRKILRRINEVIEYVLAAMLWMIVEKHWFLLACAAVVAMFMW